MTSNTYRQASAVPSLLEERDPDNALLSRMPLRRMEAEALYDTLLLAAGRLDETPFGPPDRVQVRPDGLATPLGTGRGWRRSLYVQQQRKIIVTHLENFDFPQMNPNCVERRDSTVALQALHLMNNGMVQQLADSLARRVRKEAGEDPARQVELIYLIALNRFPDAEEKDLGLTALARWSGLWAERAAEQGAEAVRQKALATYCHTILNTAEFLYID
jgi:hypothetical protein